jgi:hypothetical protein
MAGLVHPDLFYPLSPRLTMLLTTIFTHGGKDDLHLLDLLPDDDMYTLREKADALLALDGEKRAAVVAREIRRQVQFAGLAGLEAVDPSWLLAGLEGEQPRTIGIILAQLSAGARSRILAQLPAAVRAHIPAKDDLQDTRLEMMRIVRQRFEMKFVPMSAPPGAPTHFYFKDITLLEARDLVQLVRALGIEQLAAAFWTIGKRKLAELCTRLDAQAADELLTAVKDTAAEDAMELSEANDFLRRVVLGARVEGTGADAKERFQRELFQKAGLFRLARAVRAERPSFVQQLAQRIPRTHGQLLKSYVYRLGEAPEIDIDKLQRLQDQVLYRVERLAERGKVNPRYLKFEFCYWGNGEEAQDEEVFE